MFEGKRYEIRELTEVRLIDVLDPIRNDCVRDNQEIEFHDEPPLLWSVCFGVPLPRCRALTSAEHGFCATRLRKLLMLSIQLDDAAYLFLAHSK